MEESHYFLKTIGLESYIDHEKTFCDDSLARDEMDNLDYPSLAYGGNEAGLKIQIGPENSDKAPETDKQEQVINDEVSQIMAKVQADDFFSSLELQSSTKTSSGVLGLNFQTKPLSGIVTRSRSLLSTSSHEPSKGSELKTDLKTIVKHGVKDKSNKDSLKKVRKARKLKKRVRKCGPKGGGKKARKTSESSDTRKQVQQNQNQTSISTKIYENNVGDKNKEEDDWMFFQQLTTKKEVSDDKIFENKQLLGSELNNSNNRRCTPELFSMSPILINDVMSEGKDEVVDLLEDEYDESFLEEMDEFSNAPPRSHTGGKWKPGSQPVRTSPMLWPTQNWETLLEDEGGKIRSETPVESGKWKSYVPPATHTGGKWKPLTPPATYTGGKWKPSDMNQRPKKYEQEMEEGDSLWKCDGQSDSSPPVKHTGGKWKPNASVSQASDHYKNESTAVKPKPDVPLASNTHGKWVSGSGKTSFGQTTLDIVANCQSTSGKCLKTSGGVIQYYCSPCNRRLSSKKMYKKHVQSELHLKRVLQENDLEFDSRSLKMFRGFFNQSGRNDRGLGKRVIKKPEIYQDNEMNTLLREKKTLPAVKIKGKKISRKEIIRCDVCKIKIPSYQLGKHLVSYYHTRRSQLADPRQRDLILNNIHAIVKQAPYQCGICKFYCNSNAAFKRHWSLPVHKEVEKSFKNHRFWCALCSFECETSRSMELHLESNSHREVIQAVNKSIPIVIRHKQIFKCDICFKEFRFNRESIFHQQKFHPETVTNTGSRFACTLCDRQCKSMKSLQKHIIQFHKDQTKVPYFCSTCNEFFATVAEAKDHRNGQNHKYKKAVAEKGEFAAKGLIRSCSFCGKTVGDLSKLKTHLLEDHRSLLPKCIKCGKVFALSQEVSRHVKKNECQFVVDATADVPSSSSYKCDICPFATDMQSEYLLHTAIHQKKNEDNNRKIACPLCGSQFMQSALGVHLRTHLKEKTYRCSMCSSTFVRKDRYVAHLKWKHFEKGDDPQKEGSKSSVIPENSSSAFPDKTQATENSKNRSAQLKISKKGDSRENITLEKRQICGDVKCKYVAKDENDLEQHSVVHVGPKVYQCPDCPYVGKTNTVIKRHYMIHLGEKQFSCPHCPFKGRLKSHLKRHLRLHTGAKPYKCPHCSYTCNILENLRKHVLNTKIHPGKKLYECKMCSFGTNGSKEFKFHMMESHAKDCRVADANIAAGIYNREEDMTHTLNPVLQEKPKLLTRNLPKKIPSKNLQQKIESLTQRYPLIAPKGDAADGRPANRTGNSIEDKRKLLEMELEKLKTQIKPETKKTMPRFYPSPADKVLKGKRPIGGTPETESRKPTTSGRRQFMTAKNDDEENGKSSEEDGDLMLVIPSVPTCSGDEPGVKRGEDLVVQSLKLSPSAYILCENEIESQETELYLLGDYEV